MLRHIQHLGTIFQRTVSLVGTWLVSILKGKALAAIVLHLQYLCLAGKLCQLRVVTIYGNHFQPIVGACLQTYHIGASVGAVVTHQFIVDLGVFIILTPFNVDIVFLDIIVKVEFDIGRLQPTLGLRDIDLGFNGFGKGDASHIIIILVLSCRYRAVVESQLVDVFRVIVFRGAVREFQLYLILVGILYDIVLRLSVHAQQGKQCK